MIIWFMSIKKFPKFGRYFGFGFDLGQECIILRIIRLRTRGIILLERIPAFRNNHDDWIMSVSDNTISSEGHTVPDSFSEVIKMNSEVTM